ncbi:hypothetical protein HNY73_004577 [Argiope bruennichi]|uniref:Uncharacterized protein n=1 Tax=Argiope bruennichi TaxID=94029 RepID=A0A8T0FS92_ARGBR|nr:hypothetical protein HNY73_004577 [Argiope bruennichi]
MREPSACSRPPQENVSRQVTNHLVLKQDKKCFQVMCHCPVCRVTASVSDRFLPPIWIMGTFSQWYIQVLKPTAYINAFF